ncbi:tetratricopeptide repeat protein [Novilysobacter spongiicola]|uniref:Tetratricopeptide repeat-containing protein n=1 Tax=Lysobacter spongiicola DSM 21749 TaxID=1122188 RepID=A0A1T4PAX6_9GAMM|nr:tetratricopeptide repeat protein [Lysobacter spongiicola]SJZ87968.1 Tetratricopeptide repeat-containing protein [Lysobacter spongiicola DSM 21749]
MESFEPLLQELGAIKWLLVFIAAGVALIAATFFFLAVNIIAVMKENRRGNSSQSKHAELEDLLASGQSTAAKFTAMEWVAAQPRRPEAHWALAKAHYQLGELSEAKQVLTGLLKVAPEEHYRVDAWLELLESEFSQKRPKSVE